MHQYCILLSISLSINIGYCYIENSPVRTRRSSSSGWSPWSKWVCTATCGGGAGRKTRKCIEPGPNKCQGGKQKYGKCNEQPCPVVPKPMSSKGWTPWMPWECPVTCGGGRGSRSRICEDPDVCEGPEEETGPCAQEPCPVDPDALNDELQRQIEQQMKTVKNNILVSQGESVVVQCKDRIASIVDREYPDSKVTWIRNGQLVVVDGKRIQLESSGNLKVNASVEDNGLWWCALELTKKVAATVSFTAFGVQNELPDIVVEKGDSFELKCKATSLSRLVKSGMDQKWIHNSTTFREQQNVKPENYETLKVKSSNFSHNGIWNCRYIERGFSLPPPRREWVTNVSRVLVVPQKSLIQKLIPIVLATVLILIVMAIMGYIYWKRIKKRQEAELLQENEQYDDDEYSDEYFSD